MDVLRPRAVRGKELRRDGDILFGNLDVLFQVGEDLILRLCVIILIKPPDDLNLILPVFFWNFKNHASDYALITKQIVRDQKFKIVVDFLKNAGKNRAKRVAYLENQIAIEFLALIWRGETIEFVLIDSF